MAKAKRRDIATEYSGASLPDARLTSRLVQIAKAVEARPDTGFPQMFPGEAELEAFYRFVGNDRVCWKDVLAPHVEASLRRASAHETVVVAHDTTEFRFGGQRDREGLTRGRTSRKGEPGLRAKQGFLGHFALAITADQHRHPLGVLGLSPWARKTTTPSRRRSEGGNWDPKAPSEQDRWLALIENVEDRIGGATSAIHVLDSEADDYRLLSALVDSCRFVVRTCYDRVLEEVSREGKQQKTYEFVAKLPVVLKQSVRVSARATPSGGRPRARGKPRAVREAVLSIKASSLTLRRPCKQSRNLPRLLRCNVVSATEISPPQGVEPVAWVLLTTEPIDTEEQILAVIDYYRCRWVIEELFRAIKSGCAYEKRQLESFENLLVALAIFVPVAWHLLNLRTMYRAMPDEPATRCFSKRQLKVLCLASSKELNETPTVKDALLAVARLGGHLKRNGEPGWQTLGRGYLELLALERGFILAQEM